MEAARRRRTAAMRSPRAASRSRAARGSPSPPPAPAPLTAPASMACSGAALADGAPAQPPPAICLVVESIRRPEVVANFDLADDLALDDFEVCDFSCVQVHWTCEICVSANGTLFGFPFSRNLRAE
jgi:hypothetical protein